jgi:poly(3-hydroxybutyrate) depolymerase
MEQTGKLKSQALSINSAMRFLLHLFALLISLSVNGQLANNNSLLRSPQAEIPATLTFSTYALTAGGTNHVLVYTPPIKYSRGNYPVVFYYHGDGGKGATQTVTNQSVGTGDGTTTVFSGNFVNTSTAQVLYSSVVVKSGATTAGTGTHAGTITGALLSSGTMSYKSTGGAFSVTFTSPPANGTAITISYQWSQIFETGMAEFLNDGDQPPRCIIVAPQLPSADTDFDLVKHFDDVKTWVLANYSVDTDRIYATGLSRGGFMIRELMKNRHAQIAAFVAYSGTYDAANQPWSSLTNRGIWCHHGTNDGTVSYPLQSLLNSANSNTLNVHPETTAYWNIGHSSTVWNDNGYNRLERTDATGTAIYDLFRFMEKFSLDQSDQSLYHVQEAERTKDIDDYRRAVSQVALLSAGAYKTSLENRLAIVKGLIGTVYTIDLGDPAQTSTGNINNLTTLSTSSSLSNIIDDAGGASTKGFTIVSQLSSAATKHSTFTPRGAGTYHGLQANFSESGATALTTTTTGSVKFTGLNAAKTYTVIIYGFYYASGVTNESRLRVTINSTQKELYTEENTFHTIKYTGLTPNGSNEITIAISAPSTRSSAVSGIDLIEH